MSGTNTIAVYDLINRNQLVHHPKTLFGSPTAVGSRTFEAAAAPLPTALPKQSLSDGDMKVTCPTPKNILATLERVIVRVGIQ